MATIDFFFQQKARREELRLAGEKATEELKMNNNSEGTANNNNKTPLYQSMGKLEDSYELRNRVFVGSKN